MNECGIKEWNIGIGLLDKKSDFRASQDDPLRPVPCEFMNNIQIYGFGFLQDFPKTQFIVNNAIDDIDTSIIWNENLNSLFDQNIFIEILLHSVFRTEQTDFSDAVFL